MSKFDKANNLVDEIFDEGFEIFGKIKAAEERVDDLLISEKEILPKPDSFDKTYMDVAGRPYDNPTKFKVRSDNVEVEVEEDWPYGMGEPIEDDTVGHEDDNIEDKEEPAEPTDPKTQNSINNVPNQSATAQKAAVKQDIEEKTMKGLTRRELLEKSEKYQKHFKRMMKMQGIKDPGDLGSDEEKKEFFNKVDRSYQTSDEKKGDYSEDD
ncbi:MAG: hypothetical protein ACTSX1_05560 [Candidatus Heimdallarchaeaceae archaeon]